MPYTDATLRLVAPDGQLVHTDRNEIYHQAIAHLTEAELLEFYRVMTVVPRFDVEAGNLQRQGQMHSYLNLDQINDVIPMHKYTHC